MGMNVLPCVIQVIFFSCLDHLLTSSLRGWQLAWPAYGFMGHFKASGMRKEAFMCYHHCNINCTIKSYDSSEQLSNKQTNGETHSSGHQARMLGEAGRIETRNLGFPSQFSYCLPDVGSSLVS